MNGHDIMNYTLNREYLINRIKELKLKQSYIAHVIGVSDKTISRWTTGKVNQIKEDNLLALADVLKCSPGNLKHSSEENEYIRNLLDKDLLTKLSPHGDFELVEQILMNSLPKYMDDELKAEVYLEIANTNWRTQNYEQARKYCMEALAIGNLTQNKKIIFHATFQIGTIDSITGSKAALSYLKEAYDLKTHAKNQSKVAALCNNLGMHLFELGYTKEAYPYIEEAFKIYEKEHKYYNMCIAIQAMLSIKLTLKDYSNFDSLIKDAIEYANKSSYLNGITSIYLYDLKRCIDLGIEVNNNHLEAVTHFFDHFDPYVSHIFYEYFILYRTHQSDQVFKELINHKRMVPFMKGVLYYTRYKHNKMESDLTESLKIFESIGCENWLKN
jgi:transcriptional regulator with XRE-family HTH domain